MRGKSGKSHLLGDNTKLGCIDRQNWKEDGCGHYCQRLWGNVLDSMCITKTYVIDPTMEKALVAWKAVEFWRDLEFQRVLVEEDALKIVHALQKKERCWSRYEQLIDDVKTMLNSFQSCYVAHTNKEANIVARYLAKLAIHQSLE